MSNELKNILNAPAEVAASRLIGSDLIREVNGQKIIGRIVETEAYDEADTASHSYRGETARTKIMFGPAGFLYVYFTYGMHYCCNIVTGPAGQGSAVLIRALEPLLGIDLMTRNRKGRSINELTNGPAKLCEAMQIDKKLNGHNLTCSPLKLVVNPEVHSSQIVKTTRIGISRAKDAELRFYLKANNFVSKT